jgi:hypothetical protein
MPRIATDNLAELICKKHQLLIQLREVGHKQRQLEENNPQPLLQLLAAKQHLINGLQLVERHLRPFHDDDPDARAWRSLADRQRSADLADECGLLLKEVMQMERDQEQRILLRRNEVAAQLQHAGRVNQAADAYRQHRIDSPQAPGRIADYGSTSSTTPLDPNATSR